MFLVHFVGDITQPLHDEAYEVGGNDVDVTYQGKQLHGYQRKTQKKSKKKKSIGVLKTSLMLMTWIIRLLGQSPLRLGHVYA